MSLHILPVQHHIIEDSGMLAGGGGVVFFTELTNRQTNRKIIRTGIELGPLSGTGNQERLDGREGAAKVPFPPSQRLERVSAFKPKKENGRVS